MVDGQPHIKRLKEDLVVPWWLLVAASLEARGNNEENLVYYGACFGLG